MMAEMFHVFVEGAADGTPDGTKRLAEAIAKHYGLPAVDLLARLRAGRFRVKGNVDRATAETYVRDLERLGARCVIEAASAGNSNPTPLPFPAQRPATPPAGVPSAPPSALASYPRPSTPPPAAGAYTSGLSAAFTPDSGSPSSGLGALEGEDAAAFSLASVDGGDEAIEKSPEPAFGPPGQKGKEGQKAETAAKKPEAKDRPKDVPVDMFAPPDADSADLAIAIADDDKHLARDKAPTPPTAAAAAPQRKSQPVVAAATVKSSKLGPLADERVRLVAGVVLAILIGFLPAHLVAKSRESSAYHRIDTQLIAVQDQADTEDAWQALDQTRAKSLERKKDERRNIALLALVIWGLVGAGVGFAWFKKIPWEDF
jgi:hypothetical protein